VHSTWVSSVQPAPANLVQVLGVHVAQHVQHGGLVGAHADQVRLAVPAQVESESKFVTKLKAVYHILLSSASFQALPGAFNVVV
jgi:hypothetical protein